MRFFRMDQEKATESISSKTAAWGPDKGETTSDTRAGPMLGKTYPGKHLYTAYDEGKQLAHGQ
jgi:hypothetical protein